MCLNTLSNAHTTNRPPFDTRATHDNDDRQQVWSVCRRHKDFQSLHSCLQGRFPALVLPRLPRPPTGGGIVLEPATLERARAGLQAYIAAVVASVPAAWGVEEFVMFLDSDDKGRRLFSRKRKKETRRWEGAPCMRCHAGRGGQGRGGCVLFVFVMPR